MAVKKSISWTSSDAGTGTGLLRRPPAMRDCQPRCTPRARQRHQGRLHHPAFFTLSPFSLLSANFAGSIIDRGTFTLSRKTYPQIIDLTCIRYRSASSAHSLSANGIYLIMFHEQTRRSIRFKRFHDVDFMLFNFMQNSSIFLV